MPGDFAILPYVLVRDRCRKPVLFLSPTQEQGKRACRLMIVASVYFPYSAHLSDEMSSRRVWRLRCTILRDVERWQRRHVLLGTVGLSPCQLTGAGRANIRSRPNRDI